MRTIRLNGQTHRLDAPDDMPLLWAIRDLLGFTGTKFGCGMGLCGGLHDAYGWAADPICVTPIRTAEGREITTIEAISKDSVGEKVQQAWVKEGVPQCGYCQCGQVMSATALLRRNSSRGIRRSTKP